MNRNNQGDELPGGKFKNDDGVELDLGVGLKTPKELLEELESQIVRKTRDCVVVLLQDLPSQWAPGKSCQIAMPPLHGTNPDIRGEILRRFIEVSAAKGWRVHPTTGPTNPAVSVTVSAITEPTVWKGLKT